jgi:hypothetical protein
MRIEARDEAARAARVAAAACVWQAGFRAHKERQRYVRQLELYRQRMAQIDAAWRALAPVRARKAAAIQQRIAAGAIQRAWRAAAARRATQSLGAVGRPPGGAAGLSSLVVPLAGGPSLHAPASLPPLRLPGAVVAGGGASPSEQHRMAAGVLGALRQQPPRVLGIMADDNDARRLGYGSLGDLRGLGDGGGSGGGGGGNSPRVGYGALGALRGGGGGGASGGAGGGDDSPRIGHGPLGALRGGGGGSSRAFAAPPVTPRSAWTGLLGRLKRSSSRAVADSAAAKEEGPGYGPLGDLRVVASSGGGGGGGSAPATPRRSESKLLGALRRAWGRPADAPPAPPAPAQLVAQPLGVLKVRSAHDLRTSSRLPAAGESAPAVSASGSLALRALLSMARPDGRAAAQESGGEPPPRTSWRGLFRRLGL